MTFVKRTKRLTGQRNFCASCGQYFTRLSVFDKHRTAYACSQGVGRGGKLG